MESFFNQFDETIPETKNTFYKISFNITAYRGNISNKRELEKCPVTYLWHYTFFKQEFKIDVGLYLVFHSENGKRYE